MLILLAFNSYIYDIVGAEISNEDYPELRLDIYYFLQTFRNSLGDIAPPVYVKWTKFKSIKETVHDDEGEVHFEMLSKGI
jgi:hypothetical protein